MRAGARARTLQMARWGVVATTAATLVTTDASLLFCRAARRKRTNSRATTCSSCDGNVAAMLSHTHTRARARTLLAYEQEVFSEKKNEASEKKNEATCSAIIIIHSNPQLDTHIPTVQPGAISRHAVRHSKKLCMNIIRPNPGGVSISALGSNAVRRAAAVSGELFSR